MCTSQTWINNCYGEKILVKCGHCPACQQEKARQRATAIRRHGKPNEICLFNTFTYTNDFVPYIDKNDRIYFFWHESRKLLPHIPVYRNKQVIRYYDRHQKQYVEKIVNRKEIIDFIPVIDYDCDGMVYNHKSLSQSSYIPVSDLVNFGTNQFVNVGEILSNYIQKLPYLQSKYDDVPLDYVGVPYYKDIQNFYKRLRQYLIRNYNYDVTKLSFFTCSELGETYFRPHFHSLVWCPVQDYELVKRAISACWQFSNDYQRRYKMSELAKAPARYVSSYLNKSPNLPAFFKTKWFKPRCSTSRNFKFDYPPFQKEAVYDHVVRRDFQYSCQVVRKGGILVDVTLPLPKYVINKYFPKLSGFSRFTCDEMVQCLYVPTRFNQLFETNEGHFRDRFESLVNLSSDDDKKIKDYNFFYKRMYKQFEKLRKCAELFEMEIRDYVALYFDTWTAYTSFLLKQLHTEVDTIYDYFNGFYDNIKDYYDGSVSIPFLDSLMFDVQCFEADPNKFSRNIGSTSNLFNEFNELHLQKGVADVYMSDFIF